MMEGWVRCEEMANEEDHVNIFGYLVHEAVENHVGKGIGLDCGEEWEVWSSASEGARGWTRER